MARKTDRRTPRDEELDPDSSLDNIDAAPKDDDQTRGKRVDTVTVERRVEWVRKAIIKGFGTADILAAIDKEPWGISRRQAFRYVAKALSEIQKASGRDRKLEVAKAIERNEMILRRALSPAKGEEPNLSAAVRANAQNARLLGLEAPTRHAHGADPDLPALPAGGDFIVLVQEVRE